VSIALITHASGPGLIRVDADRESVRNADSALGLAGHPLASGGADGFEVALFEQAHSTSDRAQQAAGERDPRLRLGISVLVDASRLLHSLDDIGHEVVDLAHVALEELAHLLVVSGFDHGLHPEVGHDRLRVAQTDV
jgi:hypothetical protein